MSKFSVVMRVSRLDEKFDKALKSALKCEPDSLEIYVDVRKMGLNFVKLKVPIRVDTYTKFIPFIYPTNNNSHNLHHNLHRMIFDAKNKWVCRLDDDDELTGWNRRELIDAYGKDDVGIIYGNKIVQRGNQQEQVKTKQITDYHQLRNAYDGGIVIFSGTTIINRDAFRQVHPLCDHGWFADWKVWYWIQRFGWKVKYVDDVLMVQNVNPNPVGVRREQYGTFPEYFDLMEEVPDEIVEYVRSLSVERSREHVGFVKP